MLKTRRGRQVWLITQLAHAELSGQMAAHWGAGDFACPGAFAPSPDPVRLRHEVVLAIGEHDNGWWEWEADPPLSASDGLPQGLSELVEDPVAGMERWRLGISRLAVKHPYASLLIADHAYWLYATQFGADRRPELAHHLSRGRAFYPPALAPEAHRFLAEVRALQDEFCERLLRASPGAERDAECWHTALAPEHRNPNIRLLQTLDALSLALCSDFIAPGVGEAKGFGADHVVFHDVPRRGWDDRVSVEIEPRGDGRIRMDPYPFDETPFRVSVPVRVVQPHSWWRQAPSMLQTYTFQRD